MAGAMRKMAVYLGLVEDDVYEYDDYDEDDIGQDGRADRNSEPPRQERREERREEPPRERRDEIPRSVPALHVERNLDEHRATVSTIPERRPESSAPVTVHK